MPPDGTDEFDDTDLPGLDDGAPEPQKPEQPEGDPLDRIDGALRKWESDLETEDARLAARRAAEAKDAEALERTKEWLRGWKLKPKTPPPMPPLDPESVVDELAPYPAMDTLVSSKFERIPARWIYVGGFLGLVLVAGFFFFRGDSEDGAVAVPSETPVVETAAPSTEAAVADTEAVVVDTEAPAVAVEDEPAAGAVPEVHTVDVVGEQVDLTVWLASTANHVLVAAPSLNSNVDDLAGLAATLAGQDCANVVAFDSSLASPDAPIFDYIIDKWLDSFGFDSDAAVSTLGSSATADDALIAGIKFGAVDVLVFSPSDPFDWESISPPIGITYATHVVARITTGDSQYRPVFDGWIAAELPTSFESYVVDGESHGTAFFNEAAAEPVLDEVSDHICHFVHDDFEFPEDFESGSTSAWQR